MCLARFRADRRYSDIGRINGVVGSVWLAPVVSSIPHLMPARSSARRPLSVASFGRRGRASWPDAASWHRTGSAGVCASRAGGRGRRRAFCAARPSRASRTPPEPLKPQAPRTMRQCRGMLALSRRAFFKTVAADTVAAGLLSASARELCANPLGMPIGCQTYPVRAMIAKDFPGTLKQACRRRISGHRVVLAGGLRRFRFRRSRQI